MAAKRNPHKSHGMNLAGAIKQRREENLRFWNEGRNMALDFSIIALGRMGFGAKRLSEFYEKLGEVWTDYSELMVDVRKDDPELWEAKAKIDREIKLYVGEKLFSPFDVRHNDEDILK